MCNDEYLNSPEPGQELEPEMAEPTDSLVSFGVELPSGCLSTHQKLKQCKIKVSLRRFFWVPTKYVLVEK